MKGREKFPAILVSGAGGFLGREIIKQLLGSENFHVIAMTSKKEVLLAEFQTSNRLEIVATDNWTTELPLGRQIDFLINCAFPRSSDPEQLAAGILFTEKLLKDAIDMNIKNIINISSQSVYSQQTKSTADEKTGIIPESVYGMAKYASERLIALACETSPKNIVYSNIRLASLSGIGLDMRMTNRFVKCALADEPIKISGGRQEISYLDIRDAGAAIIAMIKSDSALWKNVYNLGNYNSCTVLELAETVRKTAASYSGKEVKLDVQEGKSNFSNLVHSELFYSDFGWEPQYSMALMISELFDYYAGQR